MTLLSLADRAPKRGQVEEDSVNEFVDVIAVHGLNGNLEEAWTDPDSQVLWLRDLLPDSINVARVLTYGYDASVFSFYGKSSVDRIQQHAHTFVAEIQADRSLRGCSQRPIIFVCHGLGGLLVKKALVYSSTRTSKHVEHLYSIYVSTFAILFFGTPHNGAERASWHMLQTRKGLRFPWKTEESELLESLDRNSETLETITDQFAPLMKQFHIFFFWEQLRTSSGHRTAFIVEESSAGPILDDTERAGINATHTGMIQFSCSISPGYQIVVEALIRYCKCAPALIWNRWKHAQVKLVQMRDQEANELTRINSNTYMHDVLSQRRQTRKDRLRNKCFYIPQVVSSIFTGRESQSHMVESAFFGGTPIDSVGQQRRFVIYGMGGCGKTQFCCKFAQEHREQFWGVFYIDATSSDTAANSFAKLGKLGQLEATQSAGKHWLSNLEEPWLLIINNADDSHLDLESLFPEGQRGHVLINTRNPNFAVHATVGSLELGVLEEKDALVLLLRSAGVPKPWDSLTEETGKFITRALGYLALALIQAGALILQKICSLSDYLDYYNQHRRRVSQDRQAKNRATESESVYSTWDLSLYSLETRRSTASKDAIEILNVVAFYHFEQIPINIFIRANQHRSSDQGETNANSVWISMMRAFQNRVTPPALLPALLKQCQSRADPFRIRKALNELRSVSLINYDGKTESFSLHPVVHAWARDRHNAGQQKLWANIALNTLTESIALPPAELGEVHEEFRRDILTHLNVCISHCPVRISDYEKLAGGFRIAFALAFDYPGLLRFKHHVLQAAKIGYVYAERGLFDEASRYLGMVKDALIKSRGIEDQATMRAMLALAKTYWGLGRLAESVELELQVVEVQERTLGPEHRDTLVTLDQLGNSYWLNGQYHESFVTLTRATDCMKRTLGSDDPDTLTALDHLGVTLGSWHRFEDSMHTHSQVYERRKQLYGPKDLRTVETMNYLAMGLLDLKRHQEAEELMLHVCRERRIRLGKEHPWTLWAICNLARVYTKSGRLKEAENALIPGIAAAKRSLGDNHLGVLMGMGQLARVYSEQGQLEKSEELCKNVVERIQSARGHEHPDTVYAWYRFAHLYERKGDIAKAIEICSVALERVHMRLTLDHPLGKKVEAYLEVLKSRHCEIKKDQNV